MSLLQFDYESQYTHGNTMATVIVPDRPRNMEAGEFYGSGKKYRVLWLLHGTYGDNMDWVRRSMLEVYARERELIVVCPRDWNADYTEWKGFADGFDAYRAITEELVPMIHNWLPASSKPEDNVVCGLSMGGFGALKLALCEPQIFGSGLILSAAPMDPENRREPGGNNPRRINQLANAGGEEAMNASNDNTWRLIRELNARGAVPPLYVACGVEDFLYDGCYLPFRELCEKENIPVTFATEEGYGHEWRFWDKYLQKGLDHLGFPVNGDADSWRGLKKGSNFFTGAK